MTTGLNISLNNNNGISLNSTLMIMVDCHLAELGIYSKPNSPPLCSPHLTPAPKGKHNKKAYQAAMSMAKQLCNTLRQESNEMINSEHLHYDLRFQPKPIRQLADILLQVDLVKEKKTQLQKSEGAFLTALVVFLVLVFGRYENGIWEHFWLGIFELLFQKKSEVLLFDFVDKNSFQINNLQTN